ncbi:MAG TPA: ABC transporter permease [Spirochaetia bacterium]|mgnify:CR=1 FL=1|nr:ABC transporter permease [Spirochaetia bacterium]
MINKIRAIVSKELKGYFNSPIAYIVTGIFLVAMSVLYLLKDYSYAFRIADLQQYFSYIPWVFILIIPAITMRSWAEERKVGTEEILLTLPFRETELVVGKFIAPLVLLFFMLVLTLSIPFTLSFLGDFEAGQVIGRYLGVLFFGASCISIGLFISSLTDNQIISFFATAMILFFLVIISDINQLIAFPPALKGIFNWISFRYHYDTLSSGLIQTKDLFFFVITSVVFLFLNVKVLVLRKWQ